MGCLDPAQVDDREAQMAEADRPVAPVALSIRSAVGQACCHRPEQIRVHVAAVEPADTDYPPQCQQCSMNSRTAVISESLA